MKVHTKKEIEILGLKYWEPLRRNTEFIEDDKEVRSSFDPELADTKCKKYNMAYWIGHKTTTEQLIEPRQGETKIGARHRAAYFLSCLAEPKLKEQARAGFVNKVNEYTENIQQGREDQKREALDFSETGPRKISDRDLFDSDDAVFHGYLGGGISQKMTGKCIPDPLIDGKYLIIYADLTRPRNQIEQELEKIVEEFWAEERHQTILDVHNLKEQPRKKEQRQKYKLAYRIYDYYTDEKKPISFEEIALKVNRKPPTVKGLFLWIANIIHPDGIPRHRLRALPCKNCTNKTCEETGTLCVEANKILEEGDTPSGGVLPPSRIKGFGDPADPFTLATDHNQFKKHVIDKYNEDSEDESY